MSLASCRCVALLLCVLVSGCATTYTSPDASNFSASQLGTLEHPDPVHSGVVIEQIDGKWRGTGIITSYKLTPGRHSVGARATAVFVNSAFYQGAKRAVRWFDVSPGAHYVIETKIDTAALRWNFWIIDKNTGQRVDRNHP